MINNYNDEILEGSFKEIKIDSCSNNRKNENSDYDSHYEYIEKILKKQKHIYFKVITISLVVGILSGITSSYAYDNLKGINFLNSFHFSSSQEEILNDTHDINSSLSSLGINSLVSKNTTLLSISDVAELCLNSVVEISTEYVSTHNRMYQYISEGAGSGVIISKEGYIITNAHVTSNANKITVRTSNGNSYEANLVNSDSKNDIAILKIDATNLIPASLGDSDKLKVGETAIAIGNPLGKLGGTVTSGIISSLNREINIDDETMTLLQMDAAINPGNSGGGLFDSYGNLIGIVNAKASDTGIEGIGFAIPINLAISTASDLINYGYVKGRAKLGVTLTDQMIQNNNSSNIYNFFGMPITLSNAVYGTFVYDIEKGSCAEKAGLKEGDKILNIENVEINSSYDVTSLISNFKAGEKISITIERDNSKKEISVTLDEYIPDDIISQNKKA